MGWPACRDPLLGKAREMAAELEEVEGQGVPGPAACVLKFELEVSPWRTGLWASARGRDNPGDNRIYPQALYLFPTFFLQSLARTSNFQYGLQKLLALWEVLQEEGGNDLLAVCV